MIGNSNDETNFPHKLSLTDRQLSNICKASANGSSDNKIFQKLSCLRWYNQRKFLVILLLKHCLPQRRSIKKGISLAPKLEPKSDEKATECYLNYGIN